MKLINQVIAVMLFWLLCVAFGTVAIVALGLVEAHS